jgi:small subunit ribosomal protein S2
MTGVGIFFPKKNSQNWIKCTAILEAQKLNIPIVAVVDTNGDPGSIQYPIPGNDDAVRAIELFSSKVSEAIIEGKKEKIEKELQEEKKEEMSPEADQVLPEGEEPKAGEEPAVPQEPEAKE